MKSVLIVVDSRLHNDSLERLREMGEAFLMPCGAHVYDAISAHPDIYIAQGRNDDFFIARNAPAELINFFEENAIPFQFSVKELGYKYPDTALMNVVFTEKYLVGNPDSMDAKILKGMGERELIPVKQGYTRCNLLMLTEDKAITSDRGIEKALLKRQIDVLYVDSSSVELKDFAHGFFPGCCGVFEKTVYINGSLQNLPQKKEVQDFIQYAGMEIVELSDDSLQDIGGIFLINYK